RRRGPSAREPRQLASPGLWSEALGEFRASRRPVPNRNRRDRLPQTATTVVGRAIEGQFELAAHPAAAVQEPRVAETSRRVEPEKIAEAVAVEVGEADRRPLLDAFRTAGPRHAVVGHPVAARIEDPVAYLAGELVAPDDVRIAAAHVDAIGEIGDSQG